MSEAAATPRYQVADRPPRTLAEILLRWETILLCAADA